jgi:hypothetical protein
LWWKDKTCWLKKKGSYVPVLRTQPTQGVAEKFISVI